jgi:hypothetical protein
MRSDPSETGGLFIGRRPGTAPIRFTALPRRGSAARRRFDGLLANLLLAPIAAICLLCWGPIPLACLWAGSRVNYVTGSVSLGILISFIGLFVLLFGALAIMRRIDQVWVLVRRAAGHDQRTGVSTRVFAITAAIIAIGFTLWFFVIHGPGSTNRPNLEYHGSRVPHSRVV